MSFLAAEVTAILGARANPAGFGQYDRLIARATASAARGEAANQKYNTSLERSQATMARVGKVAQTGLAAGILGATAAIAASVKKAADFEQQLSSLQAVTGANARQMEKLKKQAMDAGAATKYSALEAAQAQTELAKGGLSVQKIMSGGLKGALALAAAGEMELADAAATTANALNLFKLNGTQAGHVADALASAANATTADVSDFALALTQGGAAAKAAGMSFDQTVLYLEALANAGVKGSDAGTSMKAALTQIAKPTKQSAEAMKSLGIEFFNANGKMKPLPQVAAMLDKSFGGLTQKQKLQAAATIAGTDGMRGLLALYDSSPAQLRRLEEGLQKQGSAAEMAAKKQDNLKGKLEQMQGAIETAGIALGSELLPALTSGAEQAAEAISRAVDSGDVAGFGQDIVSGGRVAVEVVGDIAGGIGDVASAAASAAGPVLHVADAVGMFTPGGIESTLAAILGFKAAQTAVPIVSALVTQVRLLGTAPTKGALAKDLIGMVGPANLAAGAVAAAGVILLTFARNESAASAAAREHAAAMRDVKAAMDEVAGKERTDAETHLDAKQATLDRKQAELDLAAAQKEHGKNSTEAQRASVALSQATLRETEATGKATQATRDRKAAIAESLKIAREEEARAKRELGTSQKGPTGTGARTGIQTKDERAERQAAAERAYKEAVEARIVAEAQGATSTLNRNRLMERSTQITAKNASGVLSLIKSMKDVPAQKRTEILLQGDQKALSRLGQITAAASKEDRKRILAVLSGDAPVRVKLAAIKTLAAGIAPARVQAVVEGDQPAKVKLAALKALASGVDGKYVAKVLAETGDSKSKVEALSGAIGRVESKRVSVTADVNTAAVNAFQAAIDAVHGKTVSVKKKARGGKGGGLSLVGEGTDPRETVFDTATGEGFVTDRPMLLGLNDTTYVIPHDAGMRGRRDDLLRQLAADMGIPGFKKGKDADKRKGPTATKKQWKDLPTPGNVKPTALPIESLEQRAADADQSWDRWKSRKQKRREDLKNARKKKKGVKEAQANFDQASKSEAEARKWRAYTARLAKQARDFQARITKTEKLADQYASEMGLANKQHDLAGYTTAKGRRGDALKRLADLLGRAHSALKDQKSATAIDLAKQIADVQSEQIENESAALDEPEASDDAYSPDEKRRLSELDRDVALAALTQGTEDDTGAAAAKEQFLTGLLGAAQGAGRSADVIRELAEAVGSARSNVASLTGKGTNDNPDLQAQLDQANEKARIADLNSRQNAALWSAWNGPGDIGMGGGPTVNVSMNMLTGADPRVALNAANAVVAGIGYQGGIASPRTQVA